MKKKVLSLALCLAMLAALTAPASAASTEAGNTVVTKTIEAQPDSGSSSDSDPDPYPVNVPSYEISIPATLSLDTGDSFEITASKMELDSRQELHVMVDYDRTFAPDGYFYLSNTENAAFRIPCMISKGYASTASDVYKRQTGRLSPASKMLQSPFSTRRTEQRRICSARSKSPRPVSAILLAPIPARFTLSLRSTTSNPPYPRRRKDSLRDSRRLS